MKSILLKLLLFAFLCFAVYSHYLSYFSAKRIISADFNELRKKNGSGEYDVQKLEIDSIRYHGRFATIHYRLTGTYSNGSIKDFIEKHYDNEPTQLEVKHGFFGWHTE